MTAQGTAAVSLSIDCGCDPEIATLRDPWWKRSLDVVVAASLLTISAPVWLAAAALIKLDSRGPALYVQQAIGRGGRPFRFYKFRTMRQGNDDSGHRRYLRAFVQGEPPASDDGGETVFKMKADPRLTRVGKLLRKLSLDELPQLLNVIKGDMILVGPRPPLPYEYELYDRWAKGRLTVRPGITGLYQITRRSQAPFREMVELDLGYIRNRSLWLDLSIILWTPAAMLLGKGAY